jgi:hypothetical protein
MVILLACGWAPAHGRVLNGMIYHERMALKPALISSLKRSGSSQAAK